MCHLRVRRGRELSHQRPPDRSQHGCTVGVDRDPSVASERQLVPCWSVCGGASYTVLCCLCGKSRHCVCWVSSHNFYFAFSFSSFFFFLFCLFLSIFLFSGVQNLIFVGLNCFAIPCKVLLKIIFRAVSGTHIFLVFPCFFFLFYQEWDSGQLCP